MQFNNIQLTSPAKQWWIFTLIFWSLIGKALNHSHVSDTFCIIKWVITFLWLQVIRATELKKGKKCSWLAIRSLLFVNLHQQKQSVTELNTLIRETASANTKNVVIVLNISGLFHSRLAVTSTKQQHKISRSLMSQLEKKTEMFFYRWQEALCVPWPNLSVDISTIVNGITVRKVM